MKKTKNIYSFIFIGVIVIQFIAHCSLFIDQSYAQNVIAQNQSLLQIAEPSMELGLIHLKKESRLNPQTIFKDHKEAFGINGDCEMRLKRTSKDLIGNKHYRYMQYFKNVLVESGEYIVHEKDGVAASINGKIANDLPVNVTPEIMEQQALDFALKYLKADEYSWQNNTLEQNLKVDAKDVKATYFPKGELMFANIDQQDNAVSKHTLAYKFIIYISKPYSVTQAVYVDAANGSVVKDVNLTMDCNRTTIQTNFNGSQYIWTYTDTFMSGFDMEDDCSPTLIKVYDVYNNDNIVHDADNIWTTSSQLSEGSSLWGIKKSLDTYGVQYNRSGYNNNDGNINIHQGALINGSKNNASFTSGYGPVIAQCLIGLGNTDNANDDWNTLDILGHEFSHGVSETETSWAGKGGETGSLNEAFSDIMGEAIEWYVTGSNDWWNGSQRAGGLGVNGTARNMANPNLSGYPLPDTYHGTNWEYTDFDNYGVHINLGPMDYAFCLISNGGDGWNNTLTSHAKGDGCYYNISGIGIIEASRIFYHALNYLGDNSGYIQACNYTIQSAIDLYGTCSKEAIQVAEAWRAVGVGSGSACFDNKTVCGTIIPYTLSLPYYRSNSIFQAAGGACTVNVGNTNPVVVTAHDYIQLSPGFNAVTGTDFNAHIDPCVIIAPK